MRFPVLLGLSLMVVAGACAQTPTKPAPVRTGPPPTGAEFVARIDANKDGAADKTEAAVDTQFAGDFDKIDLDHDGKVTAREMETFFAAMMAQAPKP